MPDDPNALTLALILTAAGVTPASALVTGLVEMLKQLPGKIAQGRERLFAFILSAALVVLAYAATAVEITLITGFGAFLAWYAIARLAMANYADITSEPNSLTGPASPG